MNNIKQWYLNNYTEITWFLIGFLTYDGFRCLAVHDYVGSAISFGLVALNYILSKR